ncbi:MAG: hypothetical protein ACI89L_001722 [Phycisphaerales bacterium]|jgi:hypothetical protein
MSQQGLSNASRINRLFRVRRRGMTAKGCMISAAIVFLILLMLGGLGTYFVVQNWRGWFAAGTQTVVNQVIDDADIPDSEKDEVKAIVADLRADFENKLITPDDFAAIMRGFTQSPLIPAVIAHQSYRRYYDANPDLTDDDKAEAKLELSRLARGIFEEQLDSAQVVATLEPITVPAGTGGGTVRMQHNGVEITLKDPAQCSIEELRLVTLNARTATDAAGVPAEHFTVDLSDELQKIIDTALGRTPTDGTEMLNTAPAPPAPDENDTPTTTDPATESATTDDP